MLILTTIFNLNRNSVNTNGVTVTERLGLEAWSVYPVPVSGGPSIASLGLSGLVPPAHVSEFLAKCEGSSSWSSVGVQQTLAPL